jgi:hypothetical protein
LREGKEEDRQCAWKRRVEKKEKKRTEKKRKRRGQCSVEIP